MVPPLTTDPFRRILVQLNFAPVPQTESRRLWVRRTRGALSNKFILNCLHAAAAVDRRDRQMDKHLIDRYIGPAPPTMRAESIMVSGRS